MIGCFRHGAFFERGTPFMSRCLLGSRPPPGRNLAAPPPPSRESVCFFWGLAAAKAPPAVSPLPFRRRSWLFAGAKTSGSLARAARWLPVGEEPSKQRDTNGGHQKKAYEKQKSQKRTSTSERRPAIIKSPGPGHAGGVSAAVAGIEPTGSESRRAGRIEMRGVPCAAAY